MDAVLRGLGRAKRDVSRERSLEAALEESSCRLDYQLHTRNRGRNAVSGSVQIAPGGLVFFDGDALRHRITPLGEGETRVSLTLEYLTDPRMHGWWRFVSNMKDSLGYFGFRQVFRRRARRRQLGPADGPGRT